MKRDFNKIRSFQINSVKEKITPTWIPKVYPEVYNIDIAIERFKLSLLNYVVIGSPYSKKGFNSLKLAWMYRLKNDYEKEKLFLNEALESLKEAYSSEDFPMYGMDRYTAMYLIAELMRKAGNTEESLRWFSNVITCTGISSRLKNLARDQKDLIKEEINEIDFTPIDPTPIEIDKIDNTKPQKGFLSRFLNKIKIL